MIVICKHTNQLGNRLFTYLPTISYALEANEKVCFLFQYKGYDNLFPNLKKEGYNSYFVSSTIKTGIISTIFYALIRFLNTFFHVIICPNEKIPLKKPFGFLCNPKWKVIRYDKAYIEKYREKLCYLFSPSDEIWHKVNNLLKADIYEIIIGVHIRRGDYRTFRDGIYYYSDEIYRQYMSKLFLLFSQKSKKVKFFICSDEPIEANFDGFKIIKQSESQMLVDLYALSKCDYIIGPPSTFSKWASFFGRKPLYQIKSTKSEITMHDFRVVDFLD